MLKKYLYIYPCCYGTLAPPPVTLSLFEWKMSLSPLCCFSWQVAWKLIMAMNFEVFFFAQLDVNLKRCVIRTTKEGTKKQMNKRAALVSVSPSPVMASRQCAVDTKHCAHWFSVPSLLEIHQWPFSRELSLSRGGGSEEKRVVPLSAHCNYRSVSPSWLTRLTGRSTYSYLVLTFKIHTNCTFPAPLPSPCVFKVPY